jgi:predicted  nucleic acid-binding Zn-ribbon protein
MEEKRSQPNHKILGVNHEVVDEATASPLTSFTVRQKQVSCFVDLTPLVKENELNYVRLRYNEYLLQCGNGPFNLDSNLDQRQEQVKDGEHDISRLKDELKKTEAERRTSENKLTREAEGHQKRANELEVDVESLRAEIAELKDGGVGAGARQQIAQEVDGALLELGRLENDVELRRKRLQV